MFLKQLHITDHKQRFLKDDKNKLEDQKNNSEQVSYLSVRNAAQCKSTALKSWKYEIKKFLAYSKKNFVKNKNESAWIKILMNDFHARCYETSLPDLTYQSESKSFDVYTKILREKFVTKCRKAIKDTNKVESSLSVHSMIFASYHLISISSLACFGDKLKPLLKSKNRRIIAFCCFLLNRKNFLYTNLLPNKNTEIFSTKQTILRKFLISEFDGK